MEELDKHKVFVEDLKMDMVPYSVAKKLLEEFKSNKIANTMSEISNAVKGLQQDLTELSKLEGL
jgi:hypothetical protein